jgi:hypothetical protein
VQQRQGEGGDFGASFANSMEHMVRIDPAIGFWITLVALIAACLLDWLVQRRVSAPEAP